MDDGGGGGGGGGVVFAMNISRLDTPCVERRGEARRGDGGSLCSNYKFAVFLLVESIVWKCICVSVRWCSFTC